MNTNERDLVLRETELHPHLGGILRQAQSLPPMPVAVVHPVEKHSLSGAMAAAEHGLIIPTLVGPEFRIRAAAEEHGIDLHGIDIVNTEHSHAAAEKAVELGRALKVQALMKGALETDELLHAILHKENGLRSEQRLSHIFALDVNTYPKLLLVTDGAINIQPDLNTKKSIIINAIALANALGIDEPKVAILAAVEMVNADMPSTIDAAALCKMADRGQIKGALLDGPLAFDNAINLEAAETKGIKSKVAGDADILLAPDLEAANILAKQMIYLGNAQAAGILMGARLPVILTSRSETLFGRLVSCALGRMVAHNLFHHV